MNVPVPGRILSIPIRETIHPFQSIYVLAGWDLLFPLHVQGCNL
jgi:hypothetical protein